MNASDRDQGQNELRAYYEAEARLGLRGRPQGRRVETRNDFIAMLQRERRSSVVDLGAGPGGDGEAFRAAGCRYHGVDLAHGNCRLAADAGLATVQGSILALPFKAESFEAGWSMSTLMHISDDDMAEAVDAMAVSLQRGAPLLVGLWGSPRDEHRFDTGLEGQRRLFRLRPFEHNRALLAPIGDIESAESWAMKETGAQYQVFRVRCRR